MAAAQPEIRYSACPHDCPSTCALEIERLGDRLIGKVRGAKDNTCTAGVVCSKVARYAERIHHPDRLTTPLRRVGGKGARDGFAPVTWDDALDLVAESLLKAEQRHGFGDGVALLHRIDRVLSGTPTRPVAGALTML